MSRQQTFVDRCLNGLVLVDEIEDFVDEWHSSDSAQQLHEFLGMTWPEYSLWVVDHSYLGFIMAARREGIPIQEYMKRFEDHREEDLPMAARSIASIDAKRLKTWLGSLKILT